MVTSAEGIIFIAEGHRKLGPDSRVSKFAADGSFIEYLDPENGPTAGVGPQQVSAPHTISIDSQGRLFVGDRDNNRILIWDQDGNYIDMWHQFSRPSGIYIDQNDRIYVADSESYGPDNPGYRKGIRIGSAVPGEIEYFIEDIESQDLAHSGPEGIGVDRLGNVYGATVRRRQLGEARADGDVVGARRELGKLTVRAKGGSPDVDGCVRYRRRPRRRRQDKSRVSSRYPLGRRDRVVPTEAAKVPAPFLVRRRLLRCRR